jgi:SIR2-like domain
MSELEPPYESIADELLNGQVVPFFGSAASAVYRPREPDTNNATRWEMGEPFLPFGAELAEDLARASSYTAGNFAYDTALSQLANAAAKTTGLQPDNFKAVFEPILRKHIGGPPGLSLIASWFAHVQMTRPALERRLREIFKIEAKPGPLHTRLAAINTVELYITTNYDDLLDRALESRHPHVLVDRLDKGLAIYKGGSLEPIARTGSDLYDLLADPRTGEPSAPILFKMHGSIDKKNRTNDSYLITEEDYVDYLGRDQGNYIPPYINSLMQEKTILFLGYSLEDWNVRVILRKLLKPMLPGSVRCWAIVFGHSPAEQKVWQSHSLNIYPMDLLVFSDRLVAELDRRKRPA